jgi:arginase
VGPAERVVFGPGGRGGGRGRARRLPGGGFWRLHDGAGHDERAAAGGCRARIVWFDAHGDVQTLETTTSGYLGGLPLRLLVGYRPELIAAQLGLRAVPERQVILVGARDLDPPEVSYLAGAQIRRSEVGRLDAAGLPGGPLYVHLDLDVIDPAQLPGLRLPVPGGPSPAQVTGALNALLGTGRVAAIGIACTWHPGHSAAAAIRQHLDAALA